MNNERSPRFPFVTLAEALQHLENLAPSLQDQPLPVAQAFTALGFAGPHGGANKTLAALAAYDLIIKKRGVVSLTETGRALLAGPSPDARLALLQRAALSPLAFRRVWRRARSLSETDLALALAARGFTAQGAKRASRIYHENAELASLASLELEPELPDRNPRRGGKFRTLPGNQPWSGPTAPQIPTLRLPLGRGVASIPRGLSEADYNLLMETLKLWKDRLVRA